MKKSLDHETLGKTLRKSTDLHSNSSQLARSSHYLLIISLNCLDYKLSLIWVSLPALPPQPWLFAFKFYIRMKIPLIPEKVHFKLSFGELIEHYSREVLWTITDRVGLVKNGFMGRHIHIFQDKFFRQFLNEILPPPHTHCSPSFKQFVITNC